jgi:hypothetical protein
MGHVMSELLSVLCSFGTGFIATQIILFFVHAQEGLNFREWLCGTMCFTAVIGIMTVMTTLTSNVTYELIKPDEQQQQVMTQEDWKFLEE